MSSAKSRSPSDSVNVQMIPLLTPMSVLFIILSIARQNRKKDNIHPLLWSLSCKEFRNVVIYTRAIICVCYRKPFQSI